MLAELPSSRLLTVVFLILLLCIAAYLRVAGVDVYHYSPDELNHIELAQGRDAADVLHKSLFEIHPPLGHLLRHYWSGFSDAVWFTRSLSLLFGLALLPLYYVIGKELAGRSAGFYSAILMTFSHGCIIQSYLVRNYTMLIFFLSVALYAWLRWRKTYALFPLLSYGLAGILASLTHFSALFAIFSIAAVESIVLLRKRAPLRRFFVWAFTNLLIAAAALSAMHEWQPLITYATRQIDTASQQQHAWFYPLFALNYLFASHEGLPYAASLLALILISVWAVFRCLPQARPAAALCLLSLALGPLLAIAGIYHSGVSRWCLWLVPCVLPVTGCALALLSGRLRYILPEPLTMSLCLLAGIGLYNPQARFKDANEYILTENEWQEYENYLAGLDDRHRIITTAVDSFLITWPAGANLYDAYPAPSVNPDGSFAQASFAVLTPWRQTHLLFQPYSYRFSAKVLMQMVKHAEGNGQLARAETLVFPTTVWSRDLTLELLQCPQLDKIITVFPQIDLNSADEEMLKHIPVIILEISKQAFFDQLIVIGGKAHACLRQKD